MFSIKWKELFPNKTGIIVFALYIILFLNQGILVTASQKSGNKYDYDIPTVVLLTETLKLLISSCLYCKDHTVLDLCQNIVKSRKVLVLYFIPAFLYCLYNNLSFENLAAFDPTTYSLVLQIRVVVTAVLFQLIFSKKLTKVQWVSLVLLMIGCMLKQVNFLDQETKSSSLNKSFRLNFDVHAISILVQVFCSCCAGVYNEYLLKETGVDVNIYIQNVFMYLDSILCNFFLLIFKGDIFNALSSDNMKQVLEFKVLLIMINNAAAGIITSFFLKNLNSILKTFASALELVLLAVLCYIIFQIPIYFNTVLSIFVVTVAMIIYSRNPVLNLTQIRENLRQSEEKLLKASLTESV